MTAVIKTASAVSAFFLLYKFFFFGYHRVFQRRVKRVPAMKARTIKRHVIILDDYEARLIYYVLRQFEKQDYREIDAIGINKEKLQELKECFHDLFKFAPNQGSRLSGGPSPGDSPEKPIGDFRARPGRDVVNGL